MSTGFAITTAIASLIAGRAFPRRTSLQAHVRHEVATRCRRVLRRYPPPHCLFDRRGDARQHAWPGQRLSLRLRRESDFKAQGCQFGCSGPMTFSWSPTTARISGWPRRSTKAIRICSRTPSGTSFTISFTRARWRAALRLVTRGWSACSPARIPSPTRRALLKQGGRGSPCLRRLSLALPVSGLTGRAIKKSGPSGMLKLCGCEPAKLDFVRFGGEAQRVCHSYDATCWNIYPDSLRIRKNSGCVIVGERFCICS